MKAILVFFLISFGSEAFGQEIEAVVQKSFTIAASTKSYSSALRKAQKAANLLQIPMDLRGLSEDQEVGLTTSEVCGCGEKHGYISRGRYDNGKYISIEYSSAFEGFSEGYYIVVLESGEKSTLKGNLAEVQKHFKDAYIKDSPVYMGCMH